MDREILFRGKRTDNGEWVCGHCEEQNSPDYHEYIVVEFAADVDIRHIDILTCDIYEVEPSTVGQYTGLTDAKGEKIFEGDVIRNKNNKGNTDFVVEWYDGGFVCRDIKVRAFGNDLTQSDADNMEIVGNIHDDEECWRINHEYQMQQD